MTTSDKRAFMDLMRRAGVAFNAPIEDAQLAVYWDGLADLELSTLTEAFRDCQETLRFFPRIVDLRDAEFGARARAEAARSKKLIARAPTGREPHCTNCEDTGFVRGLDCPGDGRCSVGHCGHPDYASGPHAYTRKCHCRATNPVLVEQRERLRVNAAKEKAHHRERA